MNFRYTLTFLLCIMLYPVLMIAADNVDNTDCTGTFSNMYYNKEAGDLLGEEIKIVLGHTHNDGLSYPIKGWFQVAIGTPFDPVEVDVRCHGSSVEFTVPDSSEYPGLFQGTLTEKGIQGTFLLPNGVVRKINLPRRASYWDKPVSR